MTFGHAVERGGFIYVYDEWVPISELGGRRPSAWPNRLGSSFVVHGHDPTDGRMTYAGMTARHRLNLDGGSYRTKRSRMAVTERNYIDVWSDLSTFWRTRESNTHSIPAPLIARLASLALRKVYHPRCVLGDLNAIFV